MTAPLRVGLIGCGGFARRYHVPALCDMPDARLTAICDTAPGEAVRSVAEEFGAALTPSLDALLAEDRCDAVIVSTPHTLHYAHVGRALDARRHVLVDKPFVGCDREAAELAARAEAAGLTAAVAFTRRFDRGCLRARELLRAGAIGPVRYVETVQLGYERSGWFLDPALGGGGPYTGRASHFADLIPWLTGAEPRRLRSRLRFGPLGRSDHGGFIDIEFDSFECRMTCIEEGWHTWDELRIFGEHGLIELRRPLDLLLGWQLVRLSGNGAALDEQVAPDPTPGDATRDFVAAVRERRAPACDFAEARICVRIIEAAFASASEGERWMELPTASVGPMSRSAASVQETT